MITQERRIASQWLCGNTKQMAALMRCNVCFRQPGRETLRFSITNCGHVVCEACLQKGKKEECGVCRSHCRTIFLSKETNPDIKMLFMDINVLCKNYSNEFTQVIEFQDSHRRKLLAHYKGKIAKLEETVKELTQQLQSLRSSQSYNKLPAPSTLKNIGPENHRTFSPYSHPVSQLSNARPVESMNFALSTPKKMNFTIAAPTRLSSISSPRERCVGNVPYKSNTASSLRSTMGILHPKVYHPQSQTASQTERTASWDFSSQRSPHLLSQTSASSQPLKSWQPITLTNILQRRH
ncbi:putative E3 SUMO-protein ligase RNF212 [Mantella aurantiaca]